jgi:hypothetical protein
MARNKKSLLNKLAVEIFKQLLLLPIIAVTLALPGYSESFTAKRAGQGFTGLTQDFTSSLSNPALLTTFDNNDKLFFSLNVAIMAADKYHVVDTATDIRKNLDAFATDINAITAQELQSSDQVKNYYDELAQQVDHIITDLQKIDKKVVKIRNGLNLQILIPNQHLNFALFTNQYGRIGGVISYSEDDEKILDDAILSGNIDLDKLQSTSTTDGYSIAEAGFMAAYPAIRHVNYDLSVGAKLKYQRIDLYFNSIKINEFDGDDFEITDDENITNKSGANVDLGLYINWGDERQWHAALVTNNLIKQTVLHVEQDITFTLKNNISLGLSYQNSWVSLATEIDLSDREQFASLKPSKYVGVGAEFSFYKNIQFRLGYRTDLNDIDDDIYTAGIGISPWDVLAVDIATFTGNNDTIGAALQLSLKI